MSTEKYYNIHHRKGYFPANERTDEFEILGKRFGFSVRKFSHITPQGQRVPTILIRETFVQNYQKDGPPALEYQADFNFDQFEKLRKNPQSRYYGVAQINPANIKDDKRDYKFLAKILSDVIPKALWEIYHDYKNPDLMHPMQLELAKAPQLLPDKAQKSLPAQRSDSFYHGKINSLSPLPHSPSLPKTNRKRFRKAIPRAPTAAAVPKTQRRRQKGECKAGEERNESTGRCRKMCKPDQMRDPTTGRCRKIGSKPTTTTKPKTTTTTTKKQNRPLKNCKPGFERNPTNNRCRKACQPNQVRSTTTGRCQKM